MKNAFTLALISLTAAAEDKCWTAEQLVKLNEGSHLCKYDVETFGVLAHDICEGWHLTAPGAEDLLEKLGYNYQDVLSGKTCLTQAHCDWISNNAVEEARTMSYKFFTSPCLCANAVLTDMTYTLGRNLDYADFNQFMQDIKYQHFDAAADDLYKTTWCKEVGVGPVGSELEAETSYKEGNKGRVVPRKTNALGT